MKSKPSYHSICRWTFNSGKGGFTPDTMRPAWHSSRLSSADAVRLISEKIAPRVPENVRLGFEVHVDTEVNERTADELAHALVEHGIALAMITPGAHSHFAYGGIASLDESERRKASELGTRTVDLAYGPLKRAWHRDAALAPTLVLWNGSYGYDLASVGVREMYRRLKEGVARLCTYEKRKGGRMFLAIEPKPNEGHPAMLLPTVASAILFWRKLKDEFGIPMKKKGVNKEFGHSEMIGLDHVYDTVEEVEHDAVVHMHVNSQGYNDGLVLGGPGKFDIDHGVRINGMNVAIASLVTKAGFGRWKGHDMQPRAYDNEEQAVDRVIRSILSWEACEMAAAKMDEKLLLQHLQKRETAKAEDLMRHAVQQASRMFDEMVR